MQTPVILCPSCRRIIAVGAQLPAVCTAAIPEKDRRSWPPGALETHPAAHTTCVEVTLDVPDDLDGEALIDAIAVRHGGLLATLVDNDVASPAPEP